MSKNDQRDSIADFFRSERRRLVSYVRKWIDDTAERDGEDIVQDVALNIFNQADVTIPIENLSAYVYRALRNRVIDYLRKRKGHVIPLESEEIGKSNMALSALISDLRYNAEKELDKKELHQQVYEAINILNGRQKAVVIETEFEGRTFRELSLRWEVPMGTLLARKSRALKKIKTILEKEAGDR